MGLKSFRKWMPMVTLVLGVLAASCSGKQGKQEGCSGCSKTMAKMQDAAARRSYSEALTIAQGAVVLLNSDDEATEGEAAEWSLNLPDGLRAVVQNVAGEGATAEAPDTLAYVFNMADEKGFVVVSTDLKEEGLIAVADCGTFEPSTDEGDAMARLYADLQRCPDIIALKTNASDCCSSDNVAPKENMPCCGHGQGDHCKGKWKEKK